MGKKRGGKKKEATQQEEGAAEVEQQQQQEEEQVAAETKEVEVDTAVAPPVAEEKATEEAPAVVEEAPAAPAPEEAQAAASEPAATEEKPAAAEPEAVPEKVEEPKTPEPALKIDTTASPETDEAQTGEGRKKSPVPHVHIAENVKSPTHSYMEEVRSPAPQHLESKDLAEWDSDKHAHVDDEVASPGGLVNRVATPKSNAGSDDGFEAAMEEEESSEASPAQASPAQAESSVEASKTAQKTDAAAEQKKCPLANSGLPNPHKNKTDSEGGSCPFGSIALAAGVALVAAVVLKKVVF